MKNVLYGKYNRMLCYYGRIALQVRPELEHSYDYFMTVDDGQNQTDIRRRCSRRNTINAIKSDTLNPGFSHRITSFRSSAHRHCLAFYTMRFIFAVLAIAASAFAKVFPLLALPQDRTSTPDRGLLSLFRKR